MVNINKPVKKMVKQTIERQGIDFADGGNGCAPPKKPDYNSRILQNILEFNVTIDSQLTTKANFIFSASTIILIFVLNKVLTTDLLALDLFTRSAWLVLLIGSFVASLAAIMIVLPKLGMFSRKERIREDVFYHKNIGKYYTRQEFSDYLRCLPKDAEKASLAYSHQIYSLATNIIPYKSEMLKISGWTLIISIMFGMLLFVLSLVL